ncbi:MAG: hypothetical protein DME00_14555 [Candidatus Rokuibacteriota bacterium]|nr:MAG: hypothetical protein DME00_14555 [Candidatus Rokubacteria bacterium]
MATATKRPLIRSIAGPKIERSRQPSGGGSWAACVDAAVVRGVELFVGSRSSTFLGYPHTWPTATPSGETTRFAAGESRARYTSHGMIPKPARGRFLEAVG